MDMNHGDEHRQLMDSAWRYVREKYGLARRGEIVASPEGFSRDVWRDFAELGWLALPLPEAHGGLGLDAVSTGMVMLAFGRGAVVEPYVSAVLLCGGLIATHGRPAQKARWLPEIASGGRRLAFAHDGPERHLSSSNQTAACRTARGWSLTGRKRLVIDGPSCDGFLISATVAPSGHLAVFQVDASAHGLEKRNVQLVDGRRACDLQFVDLAIAEDAILGDGSDAGAAVEETLDRARAALAAEAVGCMRALLEATLDHTRTRQQFNQPLSANQALRHRMVDMAVCCEEAESMATLAALMVDGSPAARAKAVSAAMDKITRSSRFVAEQAIQLHGAMGVTQEVPLGIWLKRLLAIEVSLGTPSFHRERHARLMGLQRSEFAFPAVSAAASLIPA